jgi:hypothetical protein
MLRDLILRVACGETKLEQKLDAEPEPSGYVSTAWRCTKFAIVGTPFKAEAMEVFEFGQIGGGLRCHSNCLGWCQGGAGCVEADEDGDVIVDAQAVMPPRLAKGAFPYLDILVVFPNDEPYHVRVAIEYSKFWSGSRE